MRTRTNRLHTIDDLYSSADRFFADCVPAQRAANQLTKECAIEPLRMLDAGQIARIKMLEVQNARLRRLLLEFR